MDVPLSSVNFKGWRIHQVTCIGEINSHQPEYITLDKLAVLYRCFRRFSPKKMYFGQRVWYYQVTDHKGNLIGRHCPTFADFVDLHTKVSDIYRVY